MIMNNAISVIMEQMERREKPLIAAIDGRCAAGKTTLAEQLKERTGCNVIHTDSFFLRFEQRTEERLNTAGGNIDFERLRAEVMEPLKRGGTFSYRAFDCKRMELAEEILHIKPNDVTIIEGSYSCHPALWEFYGLRVFLTVDPDEQLKRIERRNGTEALAMFRERWIPLEEKYFAVLKIAQRCDLVLDTGN